MSSRRLPQLMAAVMILVPFLQDPGKVTFDTKLDLPIDPMAFLGRAVHLWDPAGGFGQLQDQAFGYFFPLGPFFALGELLNVPPWVTQRLWEGLLLVLAAEGARRLTRCMTGVSSEAALFAGAAYALAPRVLSTLGPISAEALPTTLLPWALLPLVLYGRGDPRRAVLLSSCAVLAMGGANATLTIAMLPALLLWTLTRRQGRIRLLAWQGVGTLLAVGWWLAPLLLLGKYSPSFLDWIEPASITTKPVDLLAALRGTDHWVAYVGIGGEPVWPAGNALATRPLFVLLTSLVAALGLTGLARRDLPERRFLRVTALIGLLALVSGHTGAITGPFASDVQHVLDGALAPLRNVHKFDALLRLPLVLGAAHVLSRTQLRFQSRRLVPGLAAALAVVLALPLAVNGFRPGPGFDDVPSWWRSAAKYVDTVGQGRTLVLPAAGYERYSWGRTNDPPLQPVATSPWVVRSQVPLGGAGSARLLDSVEAVLATGRGSSALADLLVRSGVGQVLVRNDLDLRFAESLSPEVVHAALWASPGLTKVAEFGPTVTATDAAEHLGGAAAYASVEVWSVQRAVPAVRWYDARRVVQVSGGPEALLPALEAGVVGADDATVLTGDSAAPEPRALVTDTLRRRGRAFALVHRALGPTLSLGEAFDDARRVHDLLTFDAAGHQTVASYDGVVSVSASSSGAEPTAPGGASPDALPWAALDGNPLTAWRSASFGSAVGQWLEVRFASALDPRGLTAQFVASPLLGPAVAEVTVTTDRGSVRQALGTGGLRTPPGTTKTLRLTVAAVDGSARIGNVAISDLRLPGFLPTRSLSTPADLTSTVLPAVVLGMDPEPVPSCTTYAATTSCDAPGAGVLGDPDQLDRTVTTRSGGEMVLSGSVVARPDAGVFDLLDPSPGALRATASSTLGTSPAVRPGAAVDGDPRTTWVAAPSDLAPTLHLVWPSPRTLSSLKLTLSSTTGVSAPLTVRLTSGAGTREVTLRDGTASFLPLTTNQVDVTFPLVVPTTSIEPAAAVVGGAPVGVSELTFPSAGDVAQPRDPATPIELPCGRGPLVVIDGRVVPTLVRGTVRDLLSNAPLALVPCGAGDAPVRLEAGVHHLQVIGTSQFAGRTLVLKPVAAPRSAGKDRTIEVREWGAVHRVLQVGAGSEGMLAVPENANTGWVATLDGHRLTSRTIDGWQQGWLLPAGGAGRVQLDFAPDRSYRAALAGGGIGVGLLLLVTLWSCLRRRSAAPVLAGTGRRAPLLVKAGLAVAVAVLLAGVWGIAALLVGAVLLRLLRGRTWVPLVTLMSAAVVASATGLGAGVGAVRAEQLLALLAVLTVVGAAVVDREPD